MHYTYKLIKSSITHQLSLDAMVPDEDEAHGGESRVDFLHLWTAAQVGARVDTIKVHNRNSTHLVCMCTQPARNSSNNQTPAAVDKR